METHNPNPEDIPKESSDGPDPLLDLLDSEWAMYDGAGRPLDRPEMHQFSED